MLDQICGDAKDAGIIQSARNALISTNLKASSSRQGVRARHTVRVGDGLRWHRPHGVFLKSFFFFDVPAGFSRAIFYAILQNLVFDN